MNGHDRAKQDVLLMTLRVHRATDAELSSWWWRFKHYVYCTWLGFTAPPLWTKQGRQYHAFMKDFSR